MVLDTNHSLMHLQLLPFYTPLSASITRIITQSFQLYKLETLDKCPFFFLGTRDLFAHRNSSSVAPSPSGSHMTRHQKLLFISLLSAVVLFMEFILYRFEIWKMYPAGANSPVFRFCCKEVALFRHKPSAYPQLTGPIK